MCVIWIIKSYMCTCAFGLSDCVCVQYELSNHVHVCVQMDYQTICVQYGLSNRVCVQYELSYHVCVQYGWSNMYVCSMEYQTLLCVHRALDLPNLGPIYSAPFPMQNRIFFSQFRPQVFPIWLFEKKLKNSGEKMTNLSRIVRVWNVDF